MVTNKSFQKATVLYLCLLWKAIISLVCLREPFIKNVEHAKDFYHLVKSQMLANGFIQGEKKNLQNDIFWKDTDTCSVQLELFYR